MLPILLDLGIIKIYTLGIFLVLAFFWGSFFLWKMIALTSYKEEEVFDGMFFSLFGALFVGRTLYVIGHFADFGFDILKFLLINGYPGIHTMGFVFGLLGFAYLFTIGKKISFFELADYIIPPLFLALAIAKIGSFFSGSIIGTQTTFLISMVYPNLDGARHITAVYESILYFLGSFIAYKCIFLVRKKKLHEGFNIIVFIMYFSAVSLIFDPLKALQSSKGYTSPELIVSGTLLLTGCVYVLYYFRDVIGARVRRVIKKDH